MKILIGYYSKTGHTKKMAEAIAEGIKKENVTAEIKKIKDISVDELLEFEAIIFGSPTYYGVMAADLKKLLDESVKHHGKLSGKIGGAFSTSGMMGGGGETTILSILQALLVHGMIIIGDARMQHYGPLAIGEPDGNAIDTCQKYGQKIAELTKKIFG
ncbi:MAG: NAD(P)H-dependent oxidoreductase [bacterium]